MSTSTAVATRPEPKAALVAGGEIAAIIPRNIEEVFRLAAAFYGSGMAPSSLKTTEQVTVAILAGAELGFPPFQAMQAFAIVNNRPCIWGDAIPALLWSKGFRIAEWFDNDDEPTKAFCRVTRPDNGEVIERTYSLIDAKKANLLGKAGTWQTNQKRMLQMRARGFSARDGASDVLKGFQIREEVEDYQQVRDVSPRSTGMRARLEARTPTGGFDPDHVASELDTALAGDRLPAHDAETGEIIDAEIDPPAAEAEDLFPGDRNPSTTRAASGEETNPGAGGVQRGSDLPTLTDRANTFEGKLRAQLTQEGRNKAWELSASLRTALDKGDPDRLAELQALFDELSGGEA